MRERTQQQVPDLVRHGVSKDSVGSGVSAPGPVHDRLIGKIGGTAGVVFPASQGELRLQLWRNARHLKSGLKAVGFDQDDRPVPVAAWALKIAEDMDHVHGALMERGIAIQRTHYVGAGPNSLLRAVLFANRKPEQISRTLDELKSLV